MVVIVSHIAIQSIEHKWVLVQAGYSPTVALCMCICLLVCHSVRWVNCGKMANSIWMPFGAVSGVS